MKKAVYQSIPDADKTELVQVGNARARAGSEASSGRGRGQYKNSNKSNRSMGSTSTTFSDKPLRYKPHGRSKELQSKLKQGVSSVKNRGDIFDQDEYSNDIFGSCFSSTMFESPYFYGPLVVFISLIAGICVYRVNNGWPWSMCFYYAAQALVGDMYAVPGDETDNSKNFTLGYFIYGEFLLAATFAVLFDSLIESSKDIQLSERLKVISEKYYSNKSYRYDNPNDTIEKSYHEGTLTCTDIHDNSEAAALNIENLLVYIDWPTYRKKYIYVVTLMFWIFIGVIYGYLMEGWDFYVSLYYAIGAISTAGVFPPNCIGGSDDYNCEMTSLQATLAGIYVIIGVPLFEVTLIELVALLRVEQKIKAREKAAVEDDLTRPLTQEDWQYGLNYLEHDVNTVSSLKSNDHSDDEEHGDEGDVHGNTTQVEEHGLKPLQRKNSNRSEQDVNSNTVKQEDGVLGSLSGHTTGAPITGRVAEATGGNNASSSNEMSSRHDELYDIKPLKKVPSTLEDHVEKVSSKVNKYNNFDGEGSSSGSSSSSSDDSSSSVEAKEYRTKEVVDLGDFVVLELIRMQRISVDEFKFLKMKFQELDGNGSYLVLNVYCYCVAKM